jgi:ubiquinone/menaquinone biosynthesis C-methylase UbiE
MNSNESSPRWAADHDVREWLDDQDRMDKMLAPFGDRMLTNAALSPGQVVLDIGCGTGATTLAAWAQVQPSGAVTGIDISAEMLERAGQRIPAADANAITLVCADAQTHQFQTASVDVAISRFGAAHFADQTAALTNIARALRPAGRLVFTEWANAADNEWMTLADSVGERVMPDTWHPARPGAGHDPTYLTAAGIHQVLERAGFTVHTLDAVKDRMWVGSDVPDVLGWFATLPESQPLQHLDDSTRTRFLDALAAELEHRARPDGVFLAGTAWLVHAQKS